jgi:flagellar hook-length control protein FliK
VERLINPPLEQISPEEEAWLTGEAAEDAALGAVFPLDGGMAAETLAAVPEADAGDAAAFRLDGPTLAEAGLPGEKPDGAETAAVRRTAARLAEDSANMDSLAEAAAAAAPPRPGPQKAAATAETAGKGRLDEARSRDKKRGASLEVRDLRTGPATDAAVRGDSLHLKAAAETRSPDSGAARGEISLELRLSSQAQDAPAVETAWETRSGQAFEDLLARELHQNFNNDIVRHASIALRDGGEGTIRLALKPESLGNVKIRLEMAENKITGHIIVESEEALRAFEREIGSLEQAFKDSGFDGANLEMSLAQDQWSADGSGAGQGWQEAEANRFLPDYGAASQYDAALERVDAPVIVDIYQRGAAAINMLV